jgi:hypothetical protein
MEGLPDELGTPGGVVEVKKGVNWTSVLPLLRAAVEWAATDMNANLYISAGKESGPPRSTGSFHARRWAVDIFQSQRRSLWRHDFQCSKRRWFVFSGGDTIRKNSHWAEAFGPGFAFRFYKELSDEALQYLAAKHRDHVHISIKP